MRYHILKHGAFLMQFKDAIFAGAAQVTAFPRPFTASHCPQGPALLAYPSTPNQHTSLGCFRTSRCNLTLGSGVPVTQAGQIWHHFLSWWDGPPRRPRPPPPPRGRHANAEASAGASLASASLPPRRGFCVFKVYAANTDRREHCRPHSPLDPRRFTQVGGAGPSRCALGLFRGPQGRPARAGVRQTRSQRDDAARLIDLHVISLVALFKVRTPSRH